MLGFVGVNCRITTEAEVHAPAGTLLSRALTVLCHKRQSSCLSLLKQRTVIYRNDLRPFSCKWQHFVLRYRWAKFYVSVDHIFSIRSSVGGHLGWLHSLATVLSDVESRSRCLNVRVCAHVCMRTCLRALLWRQTGLSSRHDLTLFLCVSIHLSLTQYKPNV